MDLELLWIAIALVMAVLITWRYLRGIDGRGQPWWRRVWSWLKDVMDAFWGVG